MTKLKQAHNHDATQGAMFEQTRAVARRTDPQTSHDAAASVHHLRESHRYVLWLFHKYGAMTDEQVWAAHDRVLDGPSREVPKISRSGLRSRRGELCPPRGKGLRDSGRTVKTEAGRQSIVWEIDPTVTPSALPAKIRNLRPSQRIVYNLFVEHDKLRSGFTHTELYNIYLVLHKGDDEVMTDSGVRSRCAELVALGLVRKQSEAATPAGPVAVWGLA